MKLLASRARAADPRRRGAMLILFAMLVFAFLAVAGVVLDVGVANLTQAQMQTAVDTAALEGCRWRNFDESLPSSTHTKRRMASKLARYVFDDDLHPTRGGHYLETEPTAGGPDDEDAGRFAAGPVLDVSGGVGTHAALAHIGQLGTDMAAAVDDPWLQTNYPSNRRHGDLVAGAYVPGHEGLRHVEEPSNAVEPYRRDDFVPAAPQQSAYALSFLARMRRTSDADGNAPNSVDEVPGISSALPRLPFLFAMGSTMYQADGEPWDPRRDGLTVRASAIASARPVLRVGRVPCGDVWDHEPIDIGEGREPIAGLMPFCILLDAWVDYFMSDLVWNAQPEPDLNDPDGYSDLRKVNVREDGALVRDINGNSQVVGWFCLPVLGPGEDPCTPEPGRWPDAIGRVVPEAAGAPGRGFRFTRRKPAYIAIADVIDGTRRVIGFGFAHVKPPGAPGQEHPPEEYQESSPPRFVIMGGEYQTHPGVECWIAQDNASAHLNSGLDDQLLPEMSPAEWEQILNANHELVYRDLAVNPGGEVTYDFLRIRRGSVLAPVLSR